MSARSTAAVVRPNMRRAVEESGMSLEALAAATEIPVEELRNVMLNGDDNGAGLYVEDIYAVAIALDAADTFVDWFREQGAASVA